MQPIRFHLNDRLIEEADAPPTTTLLQYVRDHLELKGTKEGCAEGDCGACTVVLLDPRAPSGPTFRAVNACLVLLPMVHGLRVYTVEGLADGATLHPAQQSLLEGHGSQCGYCTPGVVMSMFEATYRKDLDAAWKLDDQMCGNLCRCTGYRPIREATAKVAGTAPSDRFAGRLDDAARSPTNATALRYEAAGQRYFAPAGFDELFDILDAFPEHRLVAGATDLGLDVTKRHARFECLVSLEALGELSHIASGPRGWSFGATVRLTDMEAATGGPLPPIARMLRFFGSRQIKHRATLGGNLCNASPIGDMAPILMALSATVVLRSRAGERRVPLEDFFLGYRRTALGKGEILAAVEVPNLPPDARIGAYKVCKRRELDISAVSAGMLVRTGDDGRVTEARLCYGGMAATPQRARHAEAALVGRPFASTTVEAAAREVDHDFTPIDDHRGSARYRATVAQNLLRGFYEETLTANVRTLPDRPSAAVLPEVP